MQKIIPFIKHHKTKLILILPIIFSLFLGYAGGRAYKTYEVKMSEMHNEGKHENMANHSTMEHNDKELVDPTVYAPKILKLEAAKDTMSGYNIKLATSNFKFSPEEVGGPVTQNAGHIHVYVNDVKVGRGYSAWYHIPDSYFKTGTNTISVTLNANNHNVWWSKKGTLEARANIEIVK